MALVVFLRGVNVGGHRTFRPKLLAQELADFDVVNIGAAGTLIVRKPCARLKFLAALRAKLPFETQIALCDGAAIVEAEAQNPFGGKTAPPGTVRFVSILCGTPRLKPHMPVVFPADGDWLVRVVGHKHPVVFGEYRRHMKTIRYLGEMDKIFGVPATTRNWSTLQSVAAILKVGQKTKKAAQP